VESSNLSKLRCVGVDVQLCVDRVNTLKYNIITDILEHVLYNESEKVKVKE